MDAGTLFRAISEVCPALSAKVEDGASRATWSFEADPSATQPQKDAANNVIQTIPMEPLPPQSPSQFISSFTDAEYLLLKQKHQTDLTANDASRIKVWDIVIGNNVLDMNSADAKTLKGQLVADGILSQARADELFSAPVAGKKRF